MGDAARMVRGWGRDGGDNGRFLGFRGPQRGDGG